MAAANARDVVIFRALFFMQFAVIITVVFGPTLGRTDQNCRATTPKLELLGRTDCLFRLSAGCSHGFAFLTGDRIHSFQITCVAS